MSSNLSSYGTQNRIKDSQYQTLENGWHVRRYPDGWADCWQLQHAVKQSTFQFVTTDLPFANLDNEVIISLNAFVEGDSETCALSPYLTPMAVSCYVRSSSATQAGTRIRLYWSVRMRWR